MKKVILSILVAVAVFFVIVVMQTLVRNMTFTEAVSRPYNYFLAAIAFIGTFTAMSRKEKSNKKDYYVSWRRDESCFSAFSHSGGYIRH